MTIATLVGLAALLAALAAFFKWVRPRYRQARSTTRAVVATLVGTDEVRDPITNQLIRDAQPGVGVQVSDLRLAVTKLVEQQAHTEALQGEFHDLQRRTTVNEDDIAILKAAQIERIVNRADSAAAWRAMEAATLAQPDETPDDAA
jgi:hypothetical protein